MDMIGFTGHRDKIAKVADLQALRDQYPNATWIHGGAGGFDTQVDGFAKAHGIICRVMRPNYARHGKSAPLVRNREIVDGCQLLIACYDGRKSGGTYYTITYAQKRIPVHILSPVQNQEKEPVIAARPQARLSR